MINYAHAQAATQQPSMLASFIPLILIFLIFIKTPSLSKNIAIFTTNFYQVVLFFCTFG